MNSKEFERLLAFLSGWTKSEVDQRTRPLRELGILDKGAGRHTPDLTHVHASTMLLTLVARRATDSLEITRKLLRLRAVLPPKAPEWLQLMLTGDRLVEALALVLASPDSAVIEDLRIQADGSIAWVTIRRGATSCRVWFTASDEARQFVADYPDAYYAQGGTYVGHCFCMGEGAFAEIALSLREKTESGGVGYKPE